MSFNRIQILRFFAAFAVVVHHANVTASSYLRAASPYSWLTYGQYGVDLFFVISGFIIAYVGSTRESNYREFTARRLERIVPPYWVWTITLFLLSLIPGLARAGSFSFSHLIASLLFLNWFNGVEDYPVLNVGWSLEYEMLFYVISAIVLRFSTKRPWAVIAGIMLALVFAGSMLGTPTQPTLLFLLNPLILEFVFGVTIALALTDRKAAAVVALGCVIVLLAVPTSGWGERIWVFGTVSALIVAVTVWRDRTQPVGIWAKPLIAMGNASYSIYLVHIFTVSLCCKIFSIAWPTAPMPVAIVFVTGMVVVASYFGYWIVERPLLAWSRRRRHTAEKRLSRPAYKETTGVPTGVTTDTAEKSMVVRSKRNS